MWRPIIGMSCDQRSPFGEYYLKSDYITIVVESGGVPVIIPSFEDEELLLEALTFCDGLILTGGGDINPTFYGQTKNSALDTAFNFERDMFEIKLVQVAQELKMPVLGICRGMQVLNVSQNGTLFQDLILEGVTKASHQTGQAAKANNNPTVHQITIKKGTKLHKILGDQIEVNSYHHQGIKDLGRGLVVCATSSDGVIEAVESADESWTFGIQWHPERMKGDETMRKLFQAFIQQSGNFCRNNTINTT